MVNPDDDVDVERLARTTPMPGWQRYAACSGAAGLFFPEAGSNGAAARKVCRGCPVRYACLADHMAEHQTSYVDYGIWGGTTVLQRERIRVALRELSDG